MSALKEQDIPTPDDFQPDPGADDELGDWSDKRADQVSSTNADRVDSLLGQMAEGALAAELAKALGDTYDQWAGDGEDNSLDASRSGDIAGDATVAGYHFGETDAALGLTASVQTMDVQHVWNALGDARTRASHREADGQSVAVDETFDVGGDSLRFPCDPDGSAEEVCNCRCYMTWTFAWDGEAVNPGALYQNSADAETLGYE